MPFKCKIKSNPLGILKATMIELDLEEMVMRRVKSDKDKVSSLLSTLIL